MADREPEPPNAAADDPEDERLEGLRRYDVRTVPPGARQAWLATKTPTLPPEQLTDTVPPGQKKAESAPEGPSKPQPEPKSPEPPPTVVLSESVLNQPRPRYAAGLDQTVILPRRLEQQRARRTRLVAGLAVAALLVVIAAVALLRTPSAPTAPSAATEAPPAVPAPITTAEDPPAPTGEPVIPTNAAGAVPSAPPGAAAAPPKAIKAPKPETLPPPAAPPPPQSPQSPQPVKKSGDGIFDKPLAPPVD